ncbi:MAG: nucleotidyltransferase family protein [Rhodospirillaceae bacterium]|nr:nucleotidyltransferase family protein [Rhodospirillaceae bacterium]
MPAGTGPGRLEALVRYICTAGFARGARVSRITTAMVLAAGLGTRMRPVTDTVPKPLIKVGGKALMDWPLDEFASAGVTRAVVNVHHLADQVRAHVAARTTPGIVISDETAQLLETGGGILKALPLIGDAPFYAANTDAFTVGSTKPGTALMREAFDDNVDVVLLLHPIAQTHGFDGAGDFFMDAQGRLTRRGSATRAPYVYAGMQLLRPQVFAGLELKPFSMNPVWDRLIAAGRLKGVAGDGAWFHVGTPEAIAATDAALVRMGRAPSGVISAV